MRFQSTLGVSVVLSSLLVIAEVCFLVGYYTWSRDWTTSQIAIKNVASMDGSNHYLEEIANRENSNRVLLFVGVLNKVTFSKRREAIRSTWMSDCERLGVVCKFFVDSFSLLSGDSLTQIREETDKYRDIVAMPYKGGIKFTLRLLWMFKWAMKRYKIDYFLRIDDDHFLCLDRLVYELPYRPRNSLYWGFIHCKEKIVRVDEGWLMLTKDLIQEALSKINSTLQCHPYGDQAVALWMIQSNYTVKYFYDNGRIVHEVTAVNLKKFARPDICDRYLSLHGSYPNAMRKYWFVTEQRRLQLLQNRHYVIPAIPRYEDKCKFSNKVFDFQQFYPEYRFETKLCKDDPVWSINHDEHRGRES